MSKNNILDVGLNASAIETQEIVNFESLTEQVQAINPNKFSEKNLLDEKSGLSSLSRRMNKSIGKISKLHKSQENRNQIVYNELVKVYRLWAHEVAPKYKLKDTVKIVNRVGKNPEVRSHRRKCIELDINNKMAEREAKATGNVQLIKYTSNKTLEEKLAEEEAALEKDALPTSRETEALQEIKDNEIAQFEMANNDFDNV